MADINTLTYVNQPSYLPSEVPMYQPKVRPRPVFGVGDVSEAIAQAIGTEKLMVANVLTSLQSVIPVMLSRGNLDFGFVKLFLNMSGVTDDPNTNYNVIDAPLNIRATLTNKTDIIAIIRTIITLQREIYLPQVPIVTNMFSTLYDLSVLPLLSSVHLTGTKLDLNERELRVYITNDETWSGGLGTPYVVEDVAYASASRIIVGSAPPQVKAVIGNLDTTYFAKFAIYEPVTQTETFFDTLPIGGGGINKLVLVADPSALYKDTTQVEPLSILKVSIDVSGDVYASIKTPTAGGFGPTQKIVNNDYVDLSSAVIGAEPLRFFSAPGTSEYYRYLLNFEGVSSKDIGGYDET